jgi:GNAT superfamily N-acetyltransferase
MTADEMPLRIATRADAHRVEALMKESAAALFPLFYDAEQSASAARHVAHVDPLLLEDGTYFLIEHRGELIACGGWSRRDKLYTGSGDSDSDTRLLDPAREPARVRAMFVHPEWTRRGLGRRILEECEAAARREGFKSLTLGATLPGVPLYLAFGFTAYREGEITMPDGRTLACVWMEKTIAAADPRGGNEVTTSQSAAMLCASAWR